MRLNKFTDYNLRVLIYLATHNDRLSTIQEIATSFAISENHLMKVIHHLAKNGTIVSKRGKGGGIHLEKDPKELSLAEIIRNAEGEPKLVYCAEPNKQDCCILPACTLPTILKEASEAFYQCLEKYTLQDLLNDQKGQALKDLLDIQYINVTEKS